MPLSWIVFISLKGHSFVLSVFGLLEPLLQWRNSNETQVLNNGRGGRQEEETGKRKESKQPRSQNSERNKQHPCSSGFSAPTTKKRTARATLPGHSGQKNIGFSFPCESSVSERVHKDAGELPSGRSAPHQGLYRLLYSQKQGRNRDQRRSCPTSEQRHR